MNKKDTIIASDLWATQEAVLPVCLCIDTSLTMATTVGGQRTGQYTTNEYGQKVPVVVGGTSRIEILEKGIQQFYDSVFSDELARLTVLVSIVTFDDEAKKVQNFRPVVVDGRPRKTPHFYPSGQTAMGEGINLALDILEKCREKYKGKGVDFYQPWLIIMSDGRNTGSPSQLNIAQKRIGDLVRNHRLGVYPFGIGRRADLELLNKLSPKQQAFQLEEVQMEGLFNWFAKSASQVSSGYIDGYSSPKLEHYEVVGWAKGL